ncbi:MAG: HU family DNA-binding protein [Gammaproteobacteria bacterium]|nr:HU family DNA-binding protein [Gammaproteobacteria bacterium]
MAKAAIAAGADISKAAAGRALDSMIDSVSGALKQGDTVNLIGFGTFMVRERAARTGRNPRTGESIKIAASKNPSFKAGKALKDAVN